MRRPGLDPWHGGADDDVALVTTNMTINQDLQQALERVASGDRDAFAEVYDATRSGVFGIALRVLRNNALAQESTQDTYLEVWRSAPHYDRSLGSPRSWINTIAHRRAVDAVRRQMRSVKRDELDGLDRRNAVPLDLVDIVERREEQVIMRRALRSLSDNQRSALVLAYYDGMTQSEVAARLDIPLGTVKTRIRDSLIKLRALVEIESLRA